MDTEAAQAIVEFAARNGQVHKPRYHFDAKEHLHTLDGKPLMGTSTVVGALGKPLTYWAAGCALTPLGWLNRKKSTVNQRLDAAGEGLSMLRDMDREQYMAKLESCYHAHAKQLKATASDGTSVHALLASYIQSCIDDMCGVPCGTLEGVQHEAVQVFSKWAVENVARFLWSEKHCYSEELWVGGISDCGCVLTNGNIAIIDFKRSGPYYSQFVQIGGYATQVEENGLFDCDGNEVPDGEQIEIEIDDLIVFPNSGKPRTEDAAKFQSRFAETVAIYKHQQEYDSK